jgi:hypothetical protein
VFPKCAPEDAVATITHTPSKTWKAVVRKQGWATTINTFRARRDAVGLRSLDLQYERASVACDRHIQVVGGWCPRNFTGYRRDLFGYAALQMVRNTCRSATRQFDPNYQFDER